METVTSGFRAATAMTLDTCIIQDTNCADLKSGQFQERGKNAEY